MHNDKNNLNGSNWSINNVTNDLSNLLGPTNSNDLFSMFTPLNQSLASSSSALSSSVPSQYSFPPNISYNELLRDIAKTSQNQGASTSTANSNQLIYPDLFTHPVIIQTALNYGVMPLQSSPSIASSNQFDTQSVHSVALRAKKRSFTEARRTSLPPTSISFLSSYEQMDPQSLLSSLQGKKSPVENDEKTRREDEEEVEDEEKRRLRGLEEEARELAAYEEFRCRPAPIIPDTFPRAPTPEDYGQLSDKNYLPTHFFRGTKLILPTGNIVTTENLKIEDILHCSTASEDTLVETARIELIEKNATMFRLHFRIGSTAIKSVLEVAPNHPFYVLGLGWCSSDPTMTLSTYGIDCMEIQQGDVVVGQIPWEYLAGKKNIIRKTIPLREAVFEGLEESHRMTVYQRAIDCVKKKNGEKKGESIRKRRWSVCETIPTRKKEKEKKKREKRSRSIDYQLEKRISMQLNEPDSSQFNQAYPTQIAFDFEI